MACSNCNTQTCGCASGTYVVSQTCPPACSEVFNSACIVYTGVDITCTDVTSGLVSTVVSRNDYLDTIITNIVSFFCNRLDPAYLPSSVVDSGDAYIVVTPATVGYVTTYTVTLDPSTLPTASLLQDGVNTVVTGDGSLGNEYEVNSIESIVEVVAGTALSVSTSSTGPYENTYTIDIDTALLPVTELQTDFGHIFITAIPNTPNTGDTTYNLEVSEVTITSIDAKLDVVNTAAGNVAPFERTFTIDVDDTLMGEFIMDTAGANIIATGGITVAYDAIAHQITIGETIGLPLIWQFMSDGVTDIPAGSPNDKLRIVADAVIDGISSTLVAGPGLNEATFTLVNEDRGSAQDIFKNVDCNNGGPSIGIAVAVGNIDTLTMVGGDDITLGVIGNTITINNDIDHVYSDVVADSGGPLQAGSTTSTLEIIGGTGISTAGVAGPNNEITINNTAFKWSRFDADVGTTTADDVADILMVAGSTGIETSIAGDTLTILNTGVTEITTAPGSGLSGGGTGVVTLVADVQRDDATTPVIAPATMVATVAKDFTHTIAEQYVQIRIIALAVSAGFVAGDDITSDCLINLSGAGTYTLTTSTYSGAIKAVVLG